MVNPYALNINVYRYKISISYPADTIGKAIGLSFDNGSSYYEEYRNLIYFFNRNFKFVKFGRPTKSEVNKFAILNKDSEDEFIRELCIAHLKKNLVIKFHKCNKKLSPIPIG
jgi:hypothetical protein